MKYFGTCQVYEIKNFASILNAIIKRVNCKKSGLGCSKYHSLAKSLGKNLFSLVEHITSGVVIR